MLSFPYFILSSPFALLFHGFPDAFHCNRDFIALILSLGGNLGPDLTWAFLIGSLYITTPFLDSEPLDRSERRGQGKGRRYRPQLGVHDDHSRGQRRRTFCPAIGRPVDTLCRIDYLVYLHAYFTVPHATDFQEYYPLDLAKSTALAKKLGIVHPTDKAAVPQVLFTKLRVTIEQDRAVSYLVIHGVDKRALRHPTLAGLRLLDEMYWAQEPKHTWVSRTQDDIPEHLWANSEWLLPFIDRDVLLGTTDDQIAMAEALMRPAFLAARSSFDEITLAADKKCALGAGEASRIARHLIASRRWRVDMSVKLDPENAVALL